MESSSDTRACCRTRIMLVEDHASLREMLADVLSHMPEFEVVAQAATVEEAVRLARAHQPDVIILDWIFPGGGGLAFLREMRPNRLHSHVLVLSGHAEAEAVEAALMGGARGFFEKGASLDEFYRGLRVVAAGGAYFGPTAAGIVKCMVDAQAPAGPEETPAPADSAEAGGKVAVLEPAAVPG